jgi:hypothetical protein
LNRAVRAAVVGMALGAGLGRGLVAAAPPERIVVIDPFPGETPGAVWARALAAPGFVKLAPNPPDMPRGFSLAEGLYDLVLAPPGGCAFLGSSMVVSSPQSVGTVRAPGGRRAAVKARFVNPHGGAITDTAAIEPIPLADQAPTDPFLWAWKSFFRDFGFQQSKDGTITLSPVPCEPYSFVVKFRNRPPALLETSRGADEVLDLREIILPELGSVSVRVEDQLEDQTTPRRYDLRGMIMKSGPGPAPEGASRKVEQKFRSPHEAVSIDLLPGTWLLELRVDERTRAEHTVTIEEGEQRDELFVLQALRLSGRVESASGMGVGEVRLDVAYGNDGMFPLVRTTSDERGIFTATIPYGGGALFLTVSPPGGSHRFVHVNPAKEDVENLRIRLADGRVTVIVRDSATGAPVPGVKLLGSHTVYQGERPIGSVMNAMATTDTSGRYTFSALDEGILKIWSVESNEWTIEPASEGRQARIRVGDPEHVIEVRVTPILNR